MTFENELKDIFVKFAHSGIFVTNLLGFEQKE